MYLEIPITDISKNVKESAGRIRMHFEIVTEG